MRRSLAFGGLAAVLIFALLFTLNYRGERRSDTVYESAPNIEFSGGRKNYASAKYEVVPGQGIGDSQKFEKVATLSQRSTGFGEDRKRIDAAISARKAVVQFEESRGLPGRRLTNLSVGVPPENFDGLIADIQAIGRPLAIEVVRNDKTNEYLQLRAKRATLEKARAGLAELKMSGGTIAERLSIQSQETSLENEIQELGVSLGDYDSQNEFCTLRITLVEGTPARIVSNWGRISRALTWTVPMFAGIALGGFLLACGAWLLAAAVATVRRGNGGTTQPKQEDQTAGGA